MLEDDESMQTLEDAKAKCVKAERCPRCGAVGRITAERVVVKATRCTQCCCHACTYSWQIPAE